MRRVGLWVGILAVIAATSAVATALVGYVAARLFGSLSIWVIDALLWGGIAVGIVVYVTWRRRRPDADVTGHQKQAGEPARPRVGLATLAPFAVLVPGIGALLASPRLQMSFHGYLHTAYVYEAIQGHLPPENPLLAGTPANDYWLFHVLLGAVSHTFRIAPPLASTLVNLVALCACLGIVAWVLNELGLAPRTGWGRGLVILFVLFGANLFGIVHVVGAALNGSAAQDPAGIATMVWSGAARSAGLFPKFLNFNGFPLGVAFFLLGLAGAVLTTRGRSALGFFCIATGVIGALAFHISTGLLATAALTTAPVAAAWLTRRRPEGDVSRRTVMLTVVLFLGGLAVMTHYVSTAARAVGPNAVFDVWNPENLRRFLSLTYPLVPLFVWGAFRALRSRRSDLVVLTWVACAGAMAACITVLPDNNQYKFDFLASLPMALVALGGWGEMREVRALRPVSGVVAVGAGVVLLANLVWQGFGYARSDLAAQDSIAYRGVDVVGVGPSSDAWEWIARHTSTGTVVVSPLTNKNQSPVLALGQRSVYALEGGPFTAGLPEYDRRRDQIRTIYSSGASPEAKLVALAAIRRTLGDRAMVVAVPSAYVASFDAAFGLEPSYESEGMNLYVFTAG